MSKTISSYHHVTETPEVECDPRPGRYFVSMVDGNRRALLLGPLPTHREALDKVEAVRAKAEELNPWAAFYAFGTARLHDDAPDMVGRLNSLFLPYCADCGATRETIETAGDEHGPVAERVCCATM